MTTTRVKIELINNNSDLELQFATQLTSDSSSFYSSCINRKNFLLKMTELDAFKNHVIEIKQDSRSATDKSYLGSIFFVKTAPQPATIHTVIDELLEKKFIIALEARIIKERLKLGRKGFKAEF